MSSTSAPQPAILNWAGKEGEFKRQVSTFRNHISKSDPKFTPEVYVHISFLSVNAVNAVNEQGNPSFIDTGIDILIIVFAVVVVIIFMSRTRALG
jgi:hypothetical protein